MSLPHEQPGMVSLVYYDDSIDLRLPSLDFLGNSDELEAEVRRKVAALPEDWRPPQRQEGEDPSGAIRVTVDDRGAFQDIDVSASWPQRLEPSGFGQALLQAHINAQGKAYEAAALAEFIKEQRKTDTDREWDERDRAAAIEEKYGSTARPEEHNAWLRSIWDDLYAVDEKLHRLERGDFDAPQETQKRISSTNGYFTATYEGRVITSITCDVERLRRADAHVLRSEAVAVFRAVQRGARDED